MLVTRKTALFAVFAVAIPLAARAETIKFLATSLAVDSNNNLNVNIDAGQTGFVQGFGLIGTNVPVPTAVTITATLTPATGAPVVGFQSQLCYPNCPIPNQVVVDSSPFPPQTYITIDATNATAGTYSVRISATAADGTHISPVTYGLLIPTPAADFKGMTAGTSMTVTITGTQTLVVGLPPPPNTDSPGVSGSYIAVLNNKGTSAITVTSSTGSITLAPGDVIAAVFSRADTIAATASGATGTLRIGFQ